jgi:transposase
MADGARCSGLNPRPAGWWTPKTGTGPVEAIRALRVAHRGAIKARTAALNQIRSLIIAAPENLRSQLKGLSAAVVAKRCAGLDHDPVRLHDPTQATAAALAGSAGGS